MHTAEDKCCLANPFLSDKTFRHTYRVVLKELECLNKLKPTALSAKQSG